MISPGLVLAPILAGLIALFVGATLLVDFPAPPRWMIGAYVVVEVVLMGTGLFLLPFSLNFGTF